MDKKVYFSLSFLIMITSLGIFLYTLPKPTKEPSLPQPTPAVLSVAAYACQKGKSPFEILSDMSKLEYQETPAGKIVTSINESAQGERKHWIYSIDEKEATVSANLFICQGEEVIRWELKSL